MRNHYDFSNAVKSPYPRLLKKQVTLRLDETVLAYFKELGAKKQLPWQTLINLYLRDCASEKIEPDIQWQRAKDLGRVRKLPPEPRRPSGKARRAREERAAET